MATKQIVFDRESKDFAMYLDSEFVGYAPTYHEAEVILDQLALDQAAQQAAQVSTDMSIPPTEDILATVKERYTTASTTICPALASSIGFARTCSTAPSSLGR